VTGAILRSCCAIAVAAACGGSQQPPPSPPPIANRVPSPASSPPSSREQRIVVEFAEFTHQICVCPDGACAQKVSEALNKWSSERAGQANKLAPEQQEQMQVLIAEMFKCVSTAMSPPTP
jgi:hypothetical protein